MREYFRCTDCLGVCCTEWERAGSHPFRCRACGGPMESLGAVHGTRLGVFTALAPPCDGRCTSAIGPACDCRCRGANHGTGRLVPVIMDGGPVPELTPPGNTAALRERGDAYRALRTAVEEAFSRCWGDVLARRAAGEWLPASVWQDFLRARDTRLAIQRAYAMRQYTARQQRLLRIADAIREAERGAP